MRRQGRGASGAEGLLGVSDGTRTRGRLDHNLGVGMAVSDRSPCLLGFRGLGLL
jgi:hypothetical protein